MTDRRRNQNRIRGPQSALTDFLAANNISAQQIRETYEQRNRQAEQQNASAQQQTPDVQDGEELEESTSNAKKRKRGNKKEDLKKKASKKAKKKAGSDDDFEGDEEDGDVFNMYKKSKPIPGQLENCEVCNKRFTVTSYSKTGPEGGLVCSPCGKDLAKDENNSAKKPKKATAGKKRRQTESNRLDGIVSNGPKALAQLCIEKVADHHLDIEEFGDLPDNVLDRLSEIFSKKRVLTPRTLRLFLRPDMDTIAIHDAAYLEVDDYKSMFAIVPKLSKLVLRNATQFKDAVMAYMMERAHNLKYLQLYAANLLSDSMWQSFFQKQGRTLETLKLQWLDASFDDKVVATMVKYCPNLQRLKLKFCKRITSDSLSTISNLKQLQHLSLHMSQQVVPDQVISLIEQLGPKLRTLSLEGFDETDDTVIEAIRLHCRSLSKFRLTDTDRVTDAAYTALFSPESSLPSLRIVDISGARDVDNNNPAGPEDAPIGLASESFKALMNHSGGTLQTLEIASCRHISHAAFCDVFDKEEKRYPELKEFNVSFCNDADTSAIKGIFACCPKLKKLTAFGCFKIEDVVVPSGIALIGVPRAQDAIEQFGEAGVDVSKALGMMGMGQVAVGA